MKLFFTNNVRLNYSRERMLTCIVCKNSITRGKFYWTPKKTIDVGDNFLVLNLFLAVMTICIVPLYACRGIAEHQKTRGCYCNASTCKPFGMWLRPIFNCHSSERIFHYPS